MTLLPSLTSSITCEAPIHATVGESTRLASDVVLETGVLPRLFTHIPPRAFVHFGHSVNDYYFPRGDCRVKESCMGCKSHLATLANNLLDDIRRLMSWRLKYCLTSPRASRRAFIYFAARVEVGGWSALSINVLFRNPHQFETSACTLARPSRLLAKVARWLLPPMMQLSLTPWVAKVNDFYSVENSLCRHGVTLYRNTHGTRTQTKERQQY